MSDEPLAGLRDLIRERERQLESLRRDLDARAARLAELHRQKAELLDHLLKVEAEIAAVASADLADGSPVPPAEPPATLPELIRKILGRARQPLRAREVHDRVLEAGYQTISRNFVKLVQNILSKMDGVEHVAGQGYRSAGES